MKRAISEKDYIECYWGLQSNPSNGFNKLEPCLTLSEIEAVLDEFMRDIPDSYPEQYFNYDIAYNHAIDDIKQAIREKMKGDKE